QARMPRAQSVEQVRFLGDEHSGPGHDRQEGQNHRRGTAPPPRSYRHARIRRSTPRAASTASAPGDKRTCFSDDTTEKFATRGKINSVQTDPGSGRPTPRLRSMARTTPSIDRTELSRHHRGALARSSSRVPATWRREVERVLI